MSDPKMPMTDAEIGDTLRRLARACSPSFDEGRFQRYAAWLLRDAKWAESRVAIGQTVSARRVRIAVDGGQMDGILERLVEFVIESPCGVVSEDQELRYRSKSIDKDIPF